MIYADHAATTSLSPLAYEAMLPFLQEQFGNPSSLHRTGVVAKRAISKAREQVANAIGASPEQILFTASGSESDSWVLHHASTMPGCHITTTTIEHHAILHTCEFLQRTGRADISFIPPDSHGCITPHAVVAAMPSETTLLSVMTANNEIGTVNDIAALARHAHQYGVLFHTDAVQAVGHLPLSVSESDVDFLSASAHKFNGPKGIGFLYCKEPSLLTPLIGGGQQENGLRGGTENVAAIVGMGVALGEAVSRIQAYQTHMHQLRRDFLHALSDALAEWYIVGNADDRLDSIVSLCIEGVRGEALLQRLDLRGICVSTGSACNSHDTVSSHVLKAIGLTERDARSVIRISFGLSNTQDEAICIAKEIARNVQALRK